MAHDTQFFEFDILELLWNVGCSCSLQWNFLKFCCTCIIKGVGLYVLFKLVASFMELESHSIGLVLYTLRCVRLLVSLFEMVKFLTVRFASFFSACYD